MKRRESLNYCHQAGLLSVTYAKEPLRRGEKKKVKYPRLVLRWGKKMHKDNHVSGGDKCYMTSVDSISNDNM